jgi:hypothetical protein
MRPIFFFIAFFVMTLALLFHAPKMHIQKLSAGQQLQLIDTAKNRAYVRVEEVSANRDATVQFDLRPVAEGGHRYEAKLCKKSCKTGFDYAENGLYGLSIVNHYGEIMLVYSDEWKIVKENGDIP